MARPFNSIEDRSLSEQVGALERQNISLKHSLDHMASEKQMLADKIVRILNTYLDADYPAINILFKKEVAQTNLVKTSCVVDASTNTISVIGLLNGILTELECPNIICKVLDTTAEGKLALSHFEVMSPNNESEEIQL
jgi:hypothetical protein